MYRNRFSAGRYITRENKRALYLFLLTLATSATSLLSFVVLARSMTVSNYGVYAYILSIIGLAGVVASVGTPTLITREIARVSAARSSAQAKGVLAFGLTTVSAGTAVVAFLGLILRGARAADAVNISGQLMLVSILVLYLLQLRGFLVATLNGASQPLRAAAPAALGGMLFLVSLATLHFMHVELDPVVVLSIQGGATILVLALQTGQIIRVFSWADPNSGAQISWVAWLMESVPFLGAGVAFSVNAQIDIFLLGVIKGPASTAVYQVGTKSASVLVLALSSLAMVYQPSISSAHFSGNTEGVKTICRVVSRLGFAVAFAAAATMVPLRREIMTHIFGPAYVDAGQIMAILILARLVNASVGAVGPYLGMTEKGKLLFMALASEAVMNVALNLLLIPKYGGLGSAVATGSSMILMNALMAVYIKRKFGVNTFVV